MFLRKANLSAEKQSQIVSAAMSRYEHEPLKDAMPTAIPQAGALRGCVPLHRKQSGVCPAQVVEAQEEEAEKTHVLETNEVSDDELEAEHHETIALMTSAKQRRAEVDQARQFFRKKIKGIWSISNIKSAREKHSFQKYVDIFRFDRKRCFFIISVSREFARWLFSS